MFFTILSCIPYAVMGGVLNTMGYGWNSYQFWVLLGCMIFSDAIHTVRSLLD